MKQAVKMGSRGQITIPQDVRQKIGLVEGSILVFEVREDGIFMRPAIPTPMKPEEYSNYRKAEFLLNNTTDEQDYQRARAEVKKLGLDPDTIDHER